MLICFSKTVKEGSHIAIDSRHLGSLRVVSPIELIAKLALLISSLNSEQELKEEN